MLGNVLPLCDELVLELLPPSVGIHLVEKVRRKGVCHHGFSSLSGVLVPGFGKRTERWLSFAADQMTMACPFYSSFLFSQRGSP